jgi:hypothetical protein
MNIKASFFVAENLGLEITALAQRGGVVQVLVLEDPPTITI